MMWFTDWLLATGFCSMTLFSSQKFMTTWKQKWMQRHKSNREGSQWTEWTPRSRRKNELGKKALLVHGMCWTAWFIHGTERHHSFGGALTGWWWLRQLFCRHHERRLDQVTIHIQTSRKASNYVRREREKILKPGPLTLKPVISSQGSPGESQRLILHLKSRWLISVSKRFVQYKQFISGDAPMLKL